VRPETTRAAAVVVRVVMDIVILQIKVRALLSD